MSTAVRQPLHTRESSTHKNRSAPLSRSRLGARPLADGELVTEGQDLRFKFGPSSEAGANRRKQGGDAEAHDRWTVLFSDR